MRVARYLESNFQQSFILIKQNFFHQLKLLPIQSQIIISLPQDNLNIFYWNVNNSIKKVIFLTKLYSGFFKNSLFSNLHFLEKNYHPVLECNVCGNIKIMVIKKTFFA